MKKSAGLTENDLKHLEHCLSLAKEALDAGDEPFGSILVNQENQVIATARNRVNEKNVLAHPELELAHWGAENLSKEELINTTMYTSGEHCTMCAAAHGWVGIGKLVYLSSGEQLGSWLEEFGVSPAPINFIPVEQIIKNVDLKGPATGSLLERIKTMHKMYHLKSGTDE
jgi:tRNA(Arg) A34 adenosine deaminase TadA